MPDDRDQYRPKVPPERVRAQSAPGIPAELPDEITGKHEGDELASLRAKRPTDERIGRLEDKHDKLSGEVGDLKSKVLEVHGEMKVWPKLVDELKGAVDRSLQREHVTFTAKVDVDKATAISDTKVEETKKLATIEVAKTFALKAIAAVAALVGAYLLGREL